MSKINSKQKGKRGELEFAHFLGDLGFDSRRGQQFSGGEDSPDVICPMLAWIHFEVKRNESLNLGEAVNQAVRDCEGKTWVVAHRKNKTPWLVTMNAESFLDILRGQIGVVK